MKLDNITEAKHYNEAYLQPDYWHYKTWLYRPFLKALVAKANLKRGAHILDAGCGQGFFTWLFADLGFKALGYY